MLAAQMTSRLLQLAHSTTLAQFRSGLRDVETQSRRASPRILGLPQRGRRARHLSSAKKRWPYSLCAWRRVEPVFGSDGGEDVGSVLSSL